MSRARCRQGLRGLWMKAINSISTRYKPVKKKLAIICLGSFFSLSWNDFYEIFILFID